MSAKKNIDPRIYVYLVVTKFFDHIMPDRDSVECLDESFRLFRFKDKNTEKCYILSNIDSNVSHSDLIYVINEIFIAAQGLRSKEWELVVPKMVTNKLGQLHGWRKYNHEANCFHGCYYPLDRCNVKMFEIESDLRLNLSQLFLNHEILNGKTDMDQRYTLIGLVAGKVFSVINSNRMLLHVLKAVPLSIVNELKSIDELQRISRLCKYDVKETKSLVHQSFQEFASIRSTFNELPDFILNIQNLTNKMLVDLDGIDGYNLILYDLYRLRPGKLVEDFARVIVDHILRQTLYNFKDALTLIAPSIIAGYEQTKLTIPNKELVLVPTLMKIRLSYMIIGHAFQDHPNITLRNEYNDKAPAFLRLLIEDPVFKDPKKILKIWRSALTNNPTAEPKATTAPKQSTEQPKQKPKPKGDHKKRHRRAK